jgi:hypothetical protein
LFLKGVSDMAKTAQERKAAKTARELAKSVATYGDMRTTQAQAEAITEAANQLAQNSPELFEAPLVINVANLPKAPKKESKPMATDANKIENWLSSTFGDGDEAEDLFWDTLTSFVEKRQEEYAEMRKAKDERITKRQDQLKQLLLFNAEAEETTTAPETTKAKRKYTRKAAGATATAKPAKTGKTKLQAPGNPAAANAVLGVLTKNFQSCADIAKKLGPEFSPADIKPAAEALVASGKAKKEPGKRGPYPSIAKA